MSIQAGTFDPAKRLDLYARKNRDGSKKFSFLDGNGDAYDISAIDFKLNIKARATNTTNVLQLTVGSGLTVGGAGNNELTVTFTDTQTDIKPVIYYWELYNDTADQTWLHGEFIVSIGLSDEITESDSVTVNLEPDEINVYIGDPQSFVSSVNGNTGAITLSSSDVGLGNVDNVSLLTGAAANRIVYYNSSANGVTSSAKLSWDNTNERFLAGTGTISSGQNNYNFGDNTTLSGSWSFSVAEETTHRGNNSLSAGWFHEVGNGINTGSGSGGLTVGTDNKNYGLGGHISGVGGKIEYVSASQRCGFVHAFQVGSANGKKPLTVPYLLANDGAFNVSRNTSAQTDGHGALAQDSGILCSVNANVPTTSPRAVCIGGIGLKMPDSSPDTVMVDNLFVEKQTLGGVVSKISSVADNDNPTVLIYQNRGTTTDATLTTLHTLATTSDTIITVVGFVIARRTGGSAGTAGDIASYEIKASYKNVGGTLTLVGSGGVTVIGESQAGWDCQLNISTSNILIQVLGAVNNNITWHLSELKVLQVGS